jgi:hypothetical protein
MCHKLFLAFFLLTSVSASIAQTINAASCNQSDVQNAFNSVTASTTTVNIPAGNCTWTSTVTLTQPSGSSGLTVQGQTTCTGQGNPSGSSSGVVSCTDNTTINDGMSYTSGDPALLSVTVNGPFRMTGLTFTGQGASSTIQTYNGALNFYGASTAFRLDHNDFNNILENFMNIESTGMSGVIDHNVFNQNPHTGISLHITGATGPDWGGNLPWSQATQLGSSNFIYIEDNYFLGSGEDCDRGGRFAMRYNTAQRLGSATSAQFVLVHPTGEPGGALRGCRAWEVYGNGWSTTSGGNHTFSDYFMSSGTGVSWNNSDTDGLTDNFLTLISMRRNNTTYTQTAFPAGWGYCGTSFNGTGSPWDQNSNSTTGYHCLDQPGMGKSDLLTLGGNFPTIIDTVIGSAKSPNQQSEPIYEWMDQFVPGTGQFVNNEEPDAMFNNADYYLWCNASSPTGCTSFDGSQGVGSGQLANRPSTCTTGVAYWATDQGNWNQSGSGGQGELFKCTSTNTWTLFYTPYTYPNPLVSGATQSAPGAPTALTGTVVQ